MRHDDAEDMGFGIYQQHREEQALEELLYSPKSTTSPAAQRQWVGLTDDEWDEFSDKYGMIIFGGLKQEIEAKLKEKNNG